MTKETKKNPLLDDEESKKDDSAVSATTKKKVVAESKAVNTDAALKKDALSIEEKLNREEKVTIMVPLYDGEKPGSVHDFFINGYKLSVPKGKMVSVSRSIAVLAEQSFNIGNAETDRFRLDLAVGSAKDRALN